MSQPAIFETGRPEEEPSLNAGIIAPELQLVDKVPAAVEKRPLAGSGLLALRPALREVLAEPERNRTGLCLHEVTARRMALTVGKIFAECGGKLEIVGSEDPIAEGVLAYRFINDNLDNSYRTAFDDLLDDFGHRTGLDLRLYSVPREYLDYPATAQGVYQLRTEELHEFLRVAASGCCPEQEVQSILQGDKEAKWRLADFMIELRDEQGWKPEDYL